MAHSPFAAMARTMLINHVNNDGIKDDKKEKHDRSMFVLNFLLTRRAPVETTSTKMPDRPFKRSGSAPDTVTLARITRKTVRFESDDRLAVVMRPV